MDVNQICPYCMKQISDEQICPYCKKKTKEIPKGGHCLRPFTILRGKYLVGGVLGEGGVEITYKGMEIERQMPVIIKEFFREHLMTRDVMVSTAVMMNPDADKEVVERGKTNYLKETMFLSGLSDFSSLVGIKEFFWENDTIYRVQEYLEGETLKSFMKSKGGRIPVEELLRYMEPVIRDLHKVHIKGYIHGSISPNEFMLLENGTMKVFGIDTAIDLWQKREKSESVFFQHGYAPEEQYRTGGKLGPWTDVYALCATMYKCITGVTPLEALERLRIDEMKWPSDMGISIDVDFENALKKGMAVHAENRFQDMQQLYDAIYSHNLIKEWQPKTGTIKMVKCAIGHYYDAMVHTMCPYCETTKHTDIPERTYITPKEEQVFNVYLPQYNIGEQVYCCIMHHPQRTAWITPTSYPVDYMYISYNNLLKEQCVYETETEKWSVILNNIHSVQKDNPKVNNIQAKWDEKVSYHAPIYDAMESWDFIFSKTPIDVDRYLEGYVHQYDKKYALEKDLIESEKRKEEFMNLLNKSDQYTGKRERKSWGLFK